MDKRSKPPTPTPEEALEARRVLGDELTADPHGDSQDPYGLAADDRRICEVVWRLSAYLAGYRARRIESAPGDSGKAAAASGNGCQCRARAALDDAAGFEHRMTQFAGKPSFSH